MPIKAKGEKMIDLEKLKEMLEGKKGKKEFLRLKKGEHVLRIVPTEDKTPIKEVWLHYNIARQSFLCPKRNFNESCPVCEFASSLWRENSNDSKELAKKMFVQQKYFSPVVVREKMDEGVKWWGYSKTLFEYLGKLFLNPEYGDLSDPTSGTDLVATVSQPEGKKFPSTTVTPKRKSSKLCEDSKQLKELLANVPDLMSLLDRKTEEEIKKLLDQHFLSGNEKAAEEVSKETEKYGKGEEKKEEAKSSEPVTDVEQAFAELLEG